MVIIILQCYAVVQLVKWSTTEKAAVEDNPHRNAHRADLQQQILSMQCPSRVPLAKNYVESFDEYTDPVKRRAGNLESYIKTYRTQEFDAWLRTYEQVLEGMRFWKTTRFVPNIKSGDTMYESACGIGLNLVMTLEILKEHGIDNITVYGNEYLSDSVEFGNRVLDVLVPERGNHKGLICTADSSNLQHVPDNAFDLVYTGYISDLLDPLEFNLTEKENEQRYQQLCRRSRPPNDKDWRIEKLLDIVEQRQNDWHGKWVNEMIRIAKPGKVIIVEQQVKSQCGPHRPNIFGLSQEWWKSAIQKYQWDVEPDSLDFEDDQLFYGRYEVMMRKKATTNSRT